MARDKRWFNGLCDFLAKKIHDHGLAVLITSPIWIPILWLLHVTEL